MGIFDIFKKKEEEPKSDFGSLENKIEAPIMPPAETIAGLTGNNETGTDDNVFAGSTGLENTNPPALDITETPAVTSIPEMQEKITEFNGASLDTGTEAEEVKKDSLDIDNSIEPETTEINSGTEDTSDTSNDDSIIKPGAMAIEEETKIAASIETESDADADTKKIDEVTPDTDEEIDVVDTKETVKPIKDEDDK